MFVINLQLQPTGRLHTVLSRVLLFLDMSHVQAVQSWCLRVTNAQVMSISST